MGWEDDRGGWLGREGNGLEGTEGGRGRTTRPGREGAETSAARPLEARVYMGQRGVVGAEE